MDVEGRSNDEFKGIIGGESDKKLRKDRTGEVVKMGTEREPERGV